MHTRDFAQAIGLIVLLLLAFYIGRLSGQDLRPNDDACALVSKSQLNDFGGVLSGMGATSTSKNCGIAGAQALTKACEKVGGGLSGTGVCNFAE